MIKIAITGGPCAGKSSIISELKKHYGKSVSIVPEVATLLFEEGFPPPNPWTQSWQNRLQNAIALRQLLEEEHAQNTNSKLVFCDRGLLDGAAYLSGGIQEFCETFFIGQKAALKRYTTVIHLESLATMNPSEYKRLAKTNPNRFEDVKTAQTRELATREVWGNHNNLHILSGNINQYLDKIVSIINK